MSATVRKVSAIIVFIVVAIVGIAFTFLGEAFLENQRQLLLTEVAAGQASAIERQLARSLSSTDILAQEVIRHDGRVNDFEDFAQRTLTAIGGVSNLQLAPNGVIRKIYPMAGNEAAIGHNILVDDDQRAEAARAVDQRRLTLAGPLDLVQGGVAVIGRNPVFITDEQGKSRFWGFASALIHLDDLLAVTELDSFDEKGYSYTLSRIMQTGGNSAVFAQSDGGLFGEQQSVRIQVPNATWELTVSQLPGGPEWGLLLGIVFSLLLAGAVSWIVLYVLRQPARVQAVVRHKTRELEELAFNDHLTGLANRRLLTERLDRRISEAHRDGHSIAFLYLDLDDFKEINDSRGHEVGDQLLKEIAGRLKSEVRDTDFVSRLGGDEFGVLLLDATSRQDVSRIAGKLIAAIERPMMLDGEEVVISGSIGIARMPDDGTDSALILRNADAAMYASKRAGRGGYTFFHESHSDLLRASNRDQVSGNS
jgi:diguanylate cyclase (GGDEF)-like protein